MEMFEKLGSRQLLSFTVQEQIEQAIKDGKLPTGKKLPTEMELCGSFGVSRTVMREALRGLSAKGLISIEKGRGMFIKEISATSVTDPMHLFLTLNCRSGYALDVVHARQAIEPPIAAMAAANRNEEELRLLCDNHQRLKEWKEDFVRLAKLDGEFHLLIAKASDNPIMPLVIEPIHKLMPKIKLAIYGVVKDAHASAVEFHGKILDAIAAQDEEAARRWMAEHLKQAEVHVRMSLEDGKPQTAHVN
jgi:GntR family transcriptional regulator, transcriptional repressor for pyruvate dehydrogenase complex